MKRQPITINAADVKLTRLERAVLLQRAAEFSCNWQANWSLARACHFSPRDQLALRYWLNERMGVPLDLYRVPHYAAWLLFGLAALVAQEGRVSVSEGA